MISKVAQLNLQRYIGFFDLDTVKAHALGIYNNAGKEQLLSSSEHINNVSKLLNEKIAWDSLHDNKHPMHMPLATIGHVFFTQLTVGANEKHYWLLGFLQTEIPLDPSAITAQLKKLQHIALCLTEDYMLSETLSGMAEELSVRYEELNLLYGMDDVEAFYKNNDEQNSLKQIALNCTEYLNIDYAAIYLQDQGFFTYRLGNKLGQIDVEYMEQVIRQKLYGYVASHPETLVINRDNDIDWTDANLHIPNKLIAAPIVKDNGKLCGLLVLINALEHLDFSNSDRKLTEVLAAEASKLTQSRRDPVTGQLNRRGFTEKLEKILVEPPQLNNVSCLVVIDIDQFKVINDTSGQAGGDLLLKQITTLILRNLKKNDILARLGADEFAIILEQCSLEHSKAIADRVRLVIKQFRFLYQEKMFDLSACLGVVELNAQITSFSQALSAADLACSVAKEQGRNRVHIYQPTDEAMLKHENQMLWVSRIHVALEENQFQLYRQKIELLQGDPEQEEHYEILLRLKDKDGQILSPFHFIPAAERYNLMPKIDRWVVRTALKKMAAVLIKNPASKLVCSINLSGQSFCEDGFIAFIREQIEFSDVPANRICLEITETAAVSNLSQAVDFMEELKVVGCHFSLDDFGSGMSSFTYLKNLPVDYIKIDGYFVKTMMENQIDKAMVNSMHQIGSVMGLKSIAEFVENKEIMNELRSMGIDYGQGYGIHKPEPFI